MKKFLLFLAILISLNSFGQIKMMAVRPTDTIISVNEVKKQAVVMDSAKADIVAFKDTLQAKNDTIVKQQDYINKKELEDNILGTMSLTFLLSVYLFAFCGIFLRWAYQARKGAKTNENSPNNVNIKYWIQNNLFDKAINLFFNFVALFIIFRFAGEIYNLTLTMLTAFFVGMFLDIFIEKLMNINYSQIFKAK